METEETIMGRTISDKKGAKFCSHDCWSYLSECNVRVKEPKKYIWSDASCMANGQRADDNKRANKNF